MCVGFGIYEKMGEIAAFAVLVVVAVAGHCLLQHHYSIFQPILFYLILPTKHLTFMFFLGNIKDSFFFRQKLDIDVIFLFF